MLFKKFECQKVLVLKTLVYKIFVLNPGQKSQGQVLAVKDGPTLQSFFWGQSRSVISVVKMRYDKCPPGQISQGQMS